MELSLRNKKGSMHAGIARAHDDNDVITLPPHQNCKLVHGTAGVFYHARGNTYYNCTSYIVYSCLFPRTLRPMKVAPSVTR